MTMGGTILASSLLTVLIAIEGHTTMFGSIDEPYEKTGTRTFERPLTNTSAAPLRRSSSDDFELDHYSEHDLPIKEIA